jgi:adenylyl-sulfate kinase
MMENVGAVYWFTGLSGSGKTTLSKAAAAALRERGVPCLLIDGDEFRSGVCSDLDFSQDSRLENLRRAGEVARLFSRQGFICLCAFISPYQSVREALRAKIGPAYHEIFVDCPLEECIRRDPKAHYRRARTGEIANFTGMGAPYEPPREPDLRVRTDMHTADACTLQILDYIWAHSQGLPPRP